ncbi:MAG: hypothetical protein AAF645_16150 [Myxococcota bacterium]
MNSLERLRREARFVHRALLRGDERTRRRIDEQTPKRKHVLRALAQELGFAGWGHASAALSGRSTDFGAFFYPPSGGAYWNVWCARYDEAARIRAEANAFLFPYRHQYFIAEAGYLDHLGVPADDPRWRWAGRDWLAPKDREAQQDLLDALVFARLRRRPPHGVQMPRDGCADICL